jgi:ABC-2 type transport system ATP-binding protein
MRNSLENVIELHGLTKSFGDILAVDNLDLNVKAGEMFCFVGPDGAGKTTTIRLLCGIIDPTSGGGKILDYDLVADYELIKDNIGYLSQRFSLYGDLTIDENIEFFAEIHQVSDYKSRRNELLEFTRLIPFRDRLADRLSGGMKQKLALACTLIHKPKIIFLDEPTAGVDPVSRRDFWKILSRLLREGITIVMATPYLDEAERGTRVGLMNHGRILLADSPMKIKTHMEGRVVEIICGDIRKAFGVLKKIPQLHEVQAFGDRLNIVVKDIDSDIAMIKENLQNNGIEFKNWREVPPSLENVFISLIKSN